MSPKRDALQDEPGTLLYIVRPSEVQYEKVRKKGERRKSDIAKKFRLQRLYFRGPLIPIDLDGWRVLLPNPTKESGRLFDFVWNIGEDPLPILFGGTGVGHIYGHLELFNQWHSVHKETTNGWKFSSSPLTEEPEEHIA